MKYAKSQCDGTTLFTMLIVVRKFTEEVFEAHADEIFEEAENRLHALKGGHGSIDERKRGLISSF